jgi:hypothetical protein
MFVRVLPVTHFAQLRHEFISLGTLANLLSSLGQGDRFSALLVRIFLRLLEDQANPHTLHDAVGTRPALPAREEMLKSESRSGNASVVVGLWTRAFNHPATDKAGFFTKD